MPRIMQYKEKYAEEDFVRELDARCAWERLKTQEEIGKAIGVSGPSIGNYRNKPGKIKLETMQKIVKVLKFNPGIILRYLGYSQQEIRKFAKEILQ